ncbi:YT521-B-like domain-containing protein [Dissophora ornata]|nr:YT521-B-like domain-containing protein [Dissophora ornata]
MNNESNMDVISWSDDDDGLYDEECLRIQGNSTSSAAEIATAGDKNIAPGTRQGYIQTGHGRSHTQGWDLRNEIISIGGTTRRRTSLPKNDIIGMDGRNQPNYETSRRLSSGNDLRIDIMTMTGAAKDINPLQAAPSPTRSRTLSGPTRGRSSTTVSRVGNTQPYLRERSPLDSSAGAPVVRQKHDRYRPAQRRARSRSGSRTRSLNHSLSQSRKRSRSRSGERPWGRATGRFASNRSRSRERAWRHSRSRSRSVSRTRTKASGRRSSVSNERSEAGTMERLTARGSSQTRGRSVTRSRPETSLATGREIDSSAAAARFEERDVPRIGSLLSTVDVSSTPPFPSTIKAASAASSPLAESGAAPNAQLSDLFATAMELGNEQLEKEQPSTETSPYRGAVGSSSNAPANHIEPTFSSEQPPSSLEGGVAHEDKEQTNERYFLMRCRSEAEIDDAKQRGLWPTSPLYHDKLEEAYKTSNAVYLIFTTRLSRCFSAIAKMGSEIDWYPERTIFDISKFRQRMKLDWISRESSYVSYEEVTGPLQLSGHTIIRRHGAELDARLGRAIRDLLIQSAQRMVSVDSKGWPTKVEQDTDENQMSNIEPATEMVSVENQSRLSQMEQGADEGMAIAEVDVKDEPAELERLEDIERMEVETGERSADSPRDVVPRKRPASPEPASPEPARYSPEPVRYSPRPRDMYDDHDDYDDILAVDPTKVRMSLVPAGLSKTQKKKQRKMARQQKFQLPPL